jgi:hypothetical protein
VPSTAAAGYLALFVASFCIVLSMYGGGFATIPAYLADLFGTRMVGAIHGRLLTAWSAAGVFGPVLVNYIRDYQLAHGVPRAQVYSVTMYVLAALLAIGLLCNLAIRPVKPRHHLAPEQPAGTAAPTPRAVPAVSALPLTDGQGGLILAAWLAVWIPIGWGVWVTLQKAVLLFK